jgi:GR25 family glycosyltransferase involved in LPS biosynthesis
VKNTAGNKRQPDLSNDPPSGRNEEYSPVITCMADKPSDLSRVNSYFDHIYVVNLERKVERRMRMQEVLTRLHIRAEFFPAEDGYTERNLQEFNSYLNHPIDPEKAHEKEIKLRRKVIYAPGAWGTLKTYHRLIRDASKRGFKKILSLEDDLVFSKNFEELFGQAVNSLPADWKLLYLGASQHSWKEGIDLVAPAPLSSDDNSITFYHPLTADGAFAIGIDASIFEELLSEIGKMNCPFDSGALQCISKNYPDQCFVVYPNLVIANVGDSENMIDRKMKTFARRVRWKLDLYDFN